MRSAEQSRLSQTSFHLHIVLPSVSNVFLWFPVFLKGFDCFLNVLGCFTRFYPFFVCFKVLSKCVQWLSLVAENGYDSQ